jgi:hypothetical protein
MTARDIYRQSLCERIGIPVLSFRACRVIERYQLFTVAQLVAWLRSPASQLAQNVGPMTRAELCDAVGVPHAAAPMTLQGKLNAALERITELEEALARREEVHP